MQVLQPDVYFYDDDELVGYYLDHLQCRPLFEAARDTAKDFSTRGWPYFWTICQHARYPNGQRDAVLFHGTAGHRNPIDNGYAMIVVVDLDKNKGALDEMVQRLKGTSDRLHLDCEKASAPDIETDVIHWPT